MSQIEETLGGLRVIKAFNAEAKIQDRFEKRLTNRIYRRQQMAHPMSEFLGTATIAIVLWYGGTLILSSNSPIDASTFIYYLVIFYSIINPAKDLSKASYAIQKGLASMDRVDKILKAESNINDPEDPKPIALTESICYRDVWFKYQHEWVLKGIDLTIPKGHTVALVGQSGSGKSTLVDLLPRFYDVDKGSITIDGTDVRDATLYDLRSLMGEEQAEIERILANLSAEIGAYADSMCKSYDILVQLNLIFAKANLAYKMKATAPILNADGRIKIKKARHPLIDPEKVVATDIELGTSFDTLVITGPNTGGKTVTLKTIGLFSLMAMCGLMIPASDNSELSVFDDVLADIGDEQSIEQSLSTFSAHMTMIIQILKRANDRSLVLIDELGSGTDPAEGAALATAILERLRSMGVRLAATTHYDEIKRFALETNGVENGCCEFDIKTLRPTYRLLIGMPGRSNAFAISKSLGIDDEIILRAEELVSQENTRFEEVVKKLEDSRSVLEEKLIEAENTKRESEQILKEANEKAERIEKDAKNELDLAKAQAGNIVQKARAQVYALLDELEAVKKKQNVTAEDKAKLKAGIRNMENDADPIERRKNDEYVLPRKLKKGDNVLIFDIDKKGIILEIDETAQNALVQAGIVKMRVEFSNLRLLKEDTVKKPIRKSTRTVKTDVSRTASTEVDVRGQTAMEAIMSVDNAIDSAILMNLNTLTIIHGKGTGVLRKEIQAHLKKHPSIRSYRLGTYGEGDAGVTIAELK